ncbi:MAG: hypothetical protein ACYC7D_14310 [Nitrososphaerales archaeon]
MENNPEGRDFVFVKSEVKTVTKGKSRYDPYADFSKEQIADIKEGVQEHKEELSQEISAIKSSFQDKELKDAKTVFFVGEANDPIGAFQITQGVKSLGAQIHGYLDADHKKLLISTSEEKLESLTNKTAVSDNISKSFKEFRQLTLDEQLGDLPAVWKSKSLNVLVHIMPNLKQEQSRGYMKRIDRFLQSNNCPILWRYETENGMIASSMPRSIAESLIQVSNFVYRIDDLPIGFASVEKNRRKTRRVIGST